MRELLRAKARATMTAKGYTRLNKPQIDPLPGGRLPSIFAQRWLEFC